MSLSSGVLLCGVVGVPVQFGLTTVFIDTPEATKYFVECFLRHTRN